MRIEEHFTVSEAGEFLEAARYYAYPEEHWDTELAKGDLKAIELSMETTTKQHRLGCVKMIGHEYLFAYRINDERIMYITPLKINRNVTSTNDWRVEQGDNNY